MQIRGCSDADRAVTVVAVSAKDGTRASSTVVVTTIPDIHVGLRVGTPLSVVSDVGARVAVGASVVGDVVGETTPVQHVW